MKRRIKSILSAVPGLRSGVRQLRRDWRAFSLRAGCYLSDYMEDRRHLGWRRRPGDYWRLSSELIFQYHKLEKGLCLPPASRRFFGAEAARETSRLLDEWTAGGGAPWAPVCLAAGETLRSWRERLDETPAPVSHAALIARIDTLLAATAPYPAFATPAVPPALAPDAGGAIRDLMLSRRSIRDFDGRHVDFARVEHAVATAQLSPSACNRQPWHLHFYDQRAAIDAMLALQNGNAGFGHSVPLLAVLTADLGSFFDSSERIEPALDGGLFLMSLLLALQAQGLSTCCLNWCVLPDRDRRAHEVGHIPPQEKILTFLAVGHAREGAVAPRSARRPLQDVIRRHAGLEPPAGT